ncbi:hypothetical protein MCOR25_009762 [Pyricularia grisea]|nr:hypothetical protein MCOR25_009762 [Pyricularia grisea]
MPVWEIPSLRHSVYIIAVALRKKPLNHALVDAAEGFHDLANAARSRRVLQDYGATGVTSHDGLEALQLPQRVLLQPCLETGVEGWHERHRLLATRLSLCQVLVHAVPHRLTSIFAQRE